MGKKIFIFVLILATNYLLLTTNVSAQQVSFSLSPILTELAIKPAQSTVIKYKLANLGDPSIVKIRVLPFEAKDSVGNVNIKNALEGPIQFELENETIKLEEAFFLKNSTSQELFLNVRVSEGTPAKDYYFTILAESQPPPTQEGVANLRAKISVGSHLLITVTKEGRVEIKPKISLFQVVPKNKIRLFGLQISLFNSFDKIPIVLLVENKGKNLIKPQGEIILRGPLWYSKKFEIKSQTVLAESQKLLLLDSKNSSSNVEHLTSNSLILPGLFLGGYKLSATISFGDGTPTLFASTSFLVLPIKFTVLAAFVTILIIFLIKRLKKNDEL
ncbi:hypothetical protein A3A46_02715 [Candidatus Roizmanbacteria bacterium RIFCSPLOWO2_01_FULL_37_13]|uniref:Uncharacterized protein n=1 Tax=Candidatus Roizmanbacteria bacterium RIFCSPHIGHO2_02_FULL_38_11 TaxID=1802039 RepID=A0A1F7H1X8_9BACT|nr:MAG: hypothetical protein A3C25_01375 [Candidatus Roizmanbacteria bacterium RIFCSPHIGHO2_02_FULL_38_11]OGK34080.1 MAG: hypothetical protein A3F58_01285 [Candidatus Roizmanbacteria bacterium RIFCSPHIGHO2_12_FULL_37_9b]OGK43037.1 MAG: hypothetical protein A3A46_02715 [Candidatus Roizmanbacteria bacterium RIFCSPLOWO2_01_FULL_37_13]